MNFLSFSEIFGLEQRPLEVFQFIFDPEIIGGFYEQESWGSYDAKSHGIRYLISKKPKLYSKNLSRLTKNLHRDTFLKICYKIHDNIKVDNNRLKMFNDELLKSIGNEVDKKSPFMLTLKLLHDNSEKPYASDIFLFLCILYSIYSKFYSKLFRLYDITSIKTYDQIYSNIISAHDILNYFYFYGSRKTHCLSLSDNNKEISEYDFLDDYYCEGNQEIIISVLSGATFFIDEKLNKKIINLLEYGKTLKLIITRPEIAVPIIKRTNLSDDPLLSPYEVLNKWEKLSFKYEGQVTISLVNAPIMHEIICIDNEIMYAGLYTYNESMELPDFKLVLTKEDKHFQILHKELYFLLSLPDVDVVNEKQTMQYIGDEKNIAFLKSMLLDKENCKEIWVLSLFACYCTFGEIFEIMNQRLKEKSIKVKFLLLHPDMEKVTFEWYENLQTSLFVNFNVFRQWAEKYPENFQLRFTQLPITNRLYINASCGQMRVEHLSIPLSTSHIMATHLDKSYEEDLPLFENYISQFEKIWDKYSTC